ncbi:hypothetical protein BRC68_08640 [Halobacteriales archaeon QH_6_64_20]|nr:MAG: hypothetical protein BRC68_08640 [Halobacteriales archaeon QH_6_64_20]
MGRWPVVVGVSGRTNPDEPGRTRHRARNESRFRVTRTGAARIRKPMTTIRTDRSPVDRII